MGLKKSKKCQCQIYHDNRSSKREEEIRPVAGPVYEEIELCSKSQDIAPGVNVYIVITLLFFWNHLIVNFRIYWKFVICF